MMEPVAAELLALYDQTFGLEDFCEVLDLDPNDADAISLFDTVHAAYADIWTSLGNEEFAALLESQGNVRLHPPSP